MGKVGGGRAGHLFTAWWGAFSHTHLLHHCLLLLPVYWRCCPGHCCYSGSHVLPTPVLDSIYPLLGEPGFWDGEGDSGIAKQHAALGSARAVAGQRCARINTLATTWRAAVSRAARRINACACCAAFSLARGSLPISVLPCMAWQSCAWTRVGRFGSLPPSGELQTGEKEEKEAEGEEQAGRK